MVNENQTKGVAKKVEGSIQKTGGEIREKVGQWTGDSEGETRGKLDQVKGETKKVVGEGQKALGDVQEKVRKATGN